MAHFRDDDLALFARPLYAYLTVAPKGDRWPAPRPVWFEAAADGTLQMFSEPGSPKVARLRDTPRASVVVATPPGEPEHWVSAEGRVTLHDDGGPELTERLAKRYWPQSNPDLPDLLAGWRTNGVIRLSLHPERVTRFGA